MTVSFGFNRTQKLNLQQDYDLYSSGKWAHEYKSPEDAFLGNNTSCGQAEFKQEKMLTLRLKLCDLSKLLARVNTSTGKSH